VAVLFYESASKNLDGITKTGLLIWPRCNLRIQDERIHPIVVI
jgi:hypothetical protein